MLNSTERIQGVPGNRDRTLLPMIWLLNRIADLIKVFGWGLLISAVSCTRSDTPNKNVFDEAPVSVVISQHGTVPGAVFYVSMNSACNVAVTAGKHTSCLTLTQDTQQRLRRTLQESHFFSLPSTIGNPTLCGTEICITVVLLDHSHSVVLHASSQHGVSEDNLDRFSSVYMCLMRAVQAKVQGFDLILSKRMAASKPE